ncbi:MAG TPA: hypothetical protein VNN77_11645 [candidate division Zixibacteria bacterium]|nr:hypothetical protein [candidate division Zixibacteria bacterium]
MEKVRDRIGRDWEDFALALVLALYAILGILALGVLWAVAPGS